MAIGKFEYVINQSGVIEDSFINLFMVLTHFFRNDSNPGNDSDTLKCVWLEALILWKNHI